MAIIARSWREHPGLPGRRRGLCREMLEQLKRSERSAGEIVERFEVGWPAISRHAGSREE
jgi:DNA-binding transcriptional ArsR family regulator